MTAYKEWYEENQARLEEQYIEENKHDFDKYCEEQYNNQWG